MKVAIIGNGLVSLTLAKVLVNQGIYVDFFSDFGKKEINKSRTIGISKKNIDFLNSNGLNLKKLLWKIDKIEIYSDNLQNEKILKFHNHSNELFSIVKNFELYNHLISLLKKNFFFKKKNKKIKLNYDDYKLIINCDSNNFFTKKYFYKKFNKEYDSYAYTTVIDHKKLSRNNTAIQIFTKRGPLAFLPISSKKTSVVYSVRNYGNIDLKKTIEKYNTKYSITKINQIFNFKLISSNLRNYYHKNILAFGELLHKVHPLAGQGFNMSIRDIKLLLELIKFKIDHGLELDNSICKNFENKIKYKNYLFSSGIDFIYEFFHLESKIENSILSNSIKVLGKNKYANKIFTSLAD